MQLNLSIVEASALPPHLGRKVARPARRLEPLYYLRSFRAALASINERYADLLDDAELDFLQQFSSLPDPVQCLLTRLLMRKGVIFAVSTLRYPEVDDLMLALQHLVDLGWVDVDPTLSMQQLHGVVSRERWRLAFGNFARHPRTPDAGQLALPFHSDTAVARRVSQWHAGLAGTCVAVVVEPTATRLRSLYFGNHHQSWAEFVLSDLGLHRYERVPFDAASRAFRTRAHIEHFYRLNACLTRLHAEEPAGSIVTDAYMVDEMPGWLQARFARLQLLLGQMLEREGNHALALQAYRDSAMGKGLVRAARWHERSGDFAAAHAEADRALQLTCAEASRHALERVRRRTARRLGRHTTRASPTVLAAMELSLSQRSVTSRVERSVSAQLSTPDCKAYYVENSLFPSLFGLLCWDAIFAPLPGAFFHPYQSGPADLFTSEFRLRRTAQLDALLALLDSGDHEPVMWRNFRAKVGTRTSFVHWGRLRPEILSLALACIPARHLKLIIVRLLENLEEHCKGLPDLVQFWPSEQRYRLVEVKAPGDRLQDHQRRWLEFFALHDIPAVVCRVSWSL